MLGQLQDRHGEDLTIGGDHDHVGSPGGELGERLVVFTEFLWLIDLDLVLEREAFYRGRRDLLATTAAAIGVGDHAHDIVATLDQGAKRGDGEIRGPHVDDA